MKEVFLVAIVLALYFFISYLAYIKLLKAKGLLFVLIGFAYLFFTYWMQFLVSRLDNYVLYNDFSYDGTGRVNELVIAVSFICFITAFVNIVAVIAGKEEKKKENLIAKKTQADKDSSPDIYPIAE